jgi:predicted naringenin-chalcone synthase
VTHLYHMGCYAALPAIRSARSSLIDGSLKADVVHTELCSYHLDKNNVTAEQIVMNTLFADGAIKYSVVNQSDPQTRALEIITLKEVLVPYSENEMTWKLGAHGFMMTLTRNVPLLLAREIEQYMRNLFLKAGFDFDRDKNDFLFAIHPGGPKIIELVQKVLKLYESQVSHSKKILFQRGNMSSATLPHIWNEILNDEQTPSGKPVVTVAFGPGLTMTGAIFKVCGP